MHPRSSMRRAIAILAALAPVAACQQAPMAYIPATDRALLESQARLGSDAAGASTDRTGRLSVDDMLRAARGGAEGVPDGAQGVGAVAGGPLTRVHGGARLVPFEGERLVPEESRRAAVLLAAREARLSGKVIVTGGGERLGLGQRRAVAVATMLEAQIPGTEVRFDAELPPGQVTISGAPPTPRMPEPDVGASSRANR